MNIWIFLNLFSLHAVTIACIQFTQVRELIVYYSQNDRQQSEWQIFWAGALGPSSQQQQIVAMQLQASATVKTQFCYFGFYWPRLVTNQRPWHPGLAGPALELAKFFRQWAPVFPGSLGRFASGNLNVVLSAHRVVPSLSVSGRPPTPSAWIQE